MQPEQPRWIYRFENFSRALSLLRDAIDLMQVRELTQLEKEGVIQRFGYTWELAWKVLRDYLEQGGIVLNTVTPASVIKAAVAARIVPQGEVWMRALDARNRMSHTYSVKLFEQIIADIRAHYLWELEALHLTLAGQGAGGASRG